MEAKHDLDEDDGPDLLTAVLRYRWLVIAVTVVVLGLVVAASALVSPGGSASSTVLLRVPTSRSVIFPGQTGDAALSRYTSQRALAVRSDAVLGIAAQDPALAPTSISGLRQAVTVTPSTTATSFVVTASASSPRRAGEIVRAVVSAYQTSTQQVVKDRTQAALDSIKASRAGASPAALATLDQQASEIQADNSVFGDGVDSVNQPTVVGHSLLSLRTIGLGGLLGLAVGATLAWFRADRNRRVSDASEAEPVLEAPMLGELPRLSRPITPAGRQEMSRYCRDIVLPLLATSPRLVLLVTSSERRTGTTTTALGVAAAAAAEGLKVLIIDGDTATKGMSAALGVPQDSQGLVEAALGQSLRPSKLCQPVETAPGTSLAVLPAGTIPQDRQTVTASALHGLIEHLQGVYDFIVVDAPVSGGEFVSFVIPGMVDGVLVVVRRNAAAQKLADLHQVFQLNRAKVLGYVYNSGSGLARAA